MELTEDWKEFLRLLESHDVEYMIVGGIAVAFHGYPRARGELNVFYGSFSAERLAAALRDFGFPTDADQLSGERVLAQLGREPFKIELMNFVSGLTFHEATSIRGELDGVTTTFISKESLIKNKASTDHSDHPRDADDLKHLR
ncbi:MAG: hypothetical protein AAF802_07940 [Planctomycetota bacterium]